MLRFGIQYILCSVNNVMVCEEGKWNLASDYFLTLLKMNLCSKISLKKSSL